MRNRYSLNCGRIGSQVTYRSHLHPQRQSPAALGHWPSYLGRSSISGGVPTSAPPSKLSLSLDAAAPCSISSFKEGQNSFLYVYNLPQEVGPFNNQNSWVGVSTLGRAFFHLKKTTTTTTVCCFHTKHTGFYWRLPCSFKFESKLKAIYLGELVIKSGIFTFPSPPTQICEILPGGVSNTYTYWAEIAKGWVE